MVDREKTSAKGRFGRTLFRIVVSMAIFIALDLVAGIFLVRDDLQSFRTRHFYYHHGLIPNRSALAAWGAIVYPMHTNSMGMVDSAVYRVSPESDKYRILILGDSHSEGVGVPYKKTFAGRLAADFSAKGVEVLNASCISYSQKIEYLKAKYLIEKDGLDVDHIFVLVDISDMQNELVYEHFERGPHTLIRKTGVTLRAFAKDHSAIFSMVHAYIQSRKVNEFYSKARVFEEIGDERTNMNSFELYSTFFSDFDDNTLLSNPQFHGVGEWIYDDYFRELADRGIDLGQENMKKLKALCDAHGIRLTISVHPWHSQVLRGDTADYYTDRWRSFCEEEETDFINLYPLFVNEENAVLVNKMYYIRDDNHWNEFGHERVYTRLRNYLSAQIQ